MKVIFLDVDGVLNSEDDFRVYKKENGITGAILYDNVEDRPLQLLKEIIERTDAKIVVSSSWRIGYSKSGRESIFGDKLYQKLKRRLQDHGMQIYDITPSLIPSTSRGNEIKAWLSENPVQNFIILDDDSDMEEYTNTKHFIQTTYKHGLTEELKEKAIQTLLS